MRVSKKEPQDWLSTHEAYPATVPVVHTTARPKLAMCNIFSHPQKLVQFAREHGFSGIDWSFDALTLPETPAEESMWVKQFSRLGSLEIRYHCPFYKVDLGHHDPWKAEAAGAFFRRIIRLVSKAQGKYLTVHIGLGRDSTQPLSWEATTENLARLVQYGSDRGVKICLENLASGWTSRPDIFEKLVRRSGVAVTFDIGHAHACESITSQHYAVEDFVAPHTDRVFNAHVYHTEVSGRGHAPPDRLEDIEDRLSILQRIGCNWWTLEVREVEGLLQTKRIVEEYFIQVEDQANPLSYSPSAGSTTSQG
ncbi:MAG: sugar phosphate isomerase/epimerase [Deltaproteobacteria bacterium]|nr:sugar phosphate isomerase/epimerase [Deltaproteobacteria bacterium]